MKHDGIQMKRKGQKLKPEVELQYGRRLFFKTESIYITAVVETAARRNCSLRLRLNAAKTHSCCGVAWLKSAVGQGRLP